MFFSTATECPFKHLLVSYNFLWNHTFVFIIYLVLPYLFIYAPSSSSFYSLLLTPKKTDNVQTYKQKSQTGQKMPNHNTVHTAHAPLN